MSSSQAEGAPAFWVMVARTGAGGVVSGRVLMTSSP